MKVPEILLDAQSVSSGLQKSCESQVVLSLFLYEVFSFDLTLGIVDEGSTPSQASIKNDITDVLDDGALIALTRQEMAYESLRVLPHFVEVCEDIRHESIEAWTVIYNGWNGRTQSIVERLWQSNCQTR